MSFRNNERHNVIILPGLSDGVENLQRTTNWWKKKSLEPHIFKVGWRDGTNDFQPKLEEILRLVDQFADQGMLSIVSR